MPCGFVGAFAFSCFFGGCGAVCTLRSIGDSVAIDIAVVSICGICCGCVCLATDSAFSSRVTCFSVASVDVGCGGCIKCLDDRGCCGAIGEVAVGSCRGDCASF